jgi:energy-coupling factor transporter transmembrane protein EcfT
LISGILAFILWILSKSGLRTFIKLKFVLLLGLIFTVFKGFSLEAPFFMDFQLAKDGLIYSYNFFISTFVALLLFETTTQLEIQNDLQKIPLINKTPLPIILAITISFFPEIFSTWEEVSLAAKARQKPDTKKGVKKTVKNLVAQLSALLSCMIQKAEIKRKALLSRQRKY